jgi:hypothetical protein
MDLPTGGDWSAVLPHRSAKELSDVATRFERAGLTRGRVLQALSDGGDALHAAAQRGEAGWADEFGGPMAAALLAAEVSALAAHLNSRASVVRARAVDSLLDDYSAVTVAAELGVSRQKVYDIARGNGRPSEHISHVPWRTREPGA